MDFKRDQGHKEGMKLIGLIGGVTWQSTVEYYRYMNQEMNRHLGGHNAAKILISSVNFKEVLDLAEKDDLKSVSDLMVLEAQRLERGGAEILLAASVFHFRKLSIKDVKQFLREKGLDVNL